MRAGAKQQSTDSYKERRGKVPKFTDNIIQFLLLTYFFFFLDDATIRVTNLSEDTTEGDIHDLFRRFGNISRVYLARDRDTNVCKGFAFVSFGVRDDAAKALQAINGYGYDNLILRVEWAK
jgi:RNA recognition motif-containing protein